MLSPYNSLLWNPQSSLFLESALYLGECASYLLLILPISAHVQSMFLISFENRCIVDFFHLNLCYPSLYFHAVELESLVHHSIAQSRYKAWKYWAENCREYVPHSEAPLSDVVSWNAQSGVKHPGRSFLDFSKLFTSSCDQILGQKQQQQRKLNTKKIVFTDDISQCIH